MTVSDFPRLRGKLYARREEASGAIHLRNFAEARRIAQLLRLESFGCCSIRERATLEEIAERQAREIEADIVAAQRTPQAQTQRRILEDLREQS